MFPSSAAFNAGAGTTYYIGIGVPSELLQSGPYSIRISAGPGNDDFDAAASIAALPFSTTADLRGSSGDFDDPLCGAGGPYGGGNLWYAYRATNNQVLEAIARATTFNAEIGVYTGARGNLIQQACSVGRSDSNGQWYVSAIFRATAGETYYISVGTSFNVSTDTNSPFTLNLDAAPPTPANDDFGHPIVVDSLPYNNGQDGRLATTAPDDPQCGNRMNTYWYSYKPTENERVLAGTGGPVFGVYTGTRGHLTQIYCSGEPYQQFAFLDLTGGNTYYFMVAGGGDPAVVDWLSFQIEHVPPPPPPLKVSLKIAPQANVMLKSGAARLTVTITCSREAWISLAGELSQRLGRRPISGPVDGWVYCTDSVTTTVLVSPTRGRFVPLTANAALSISAYDPLLGEVVSAYASHVLLLRQALR